MRETNFKQSEIGMIPDEWDVKKLSDVSTTSSGGTPSRRIESYYHGDIPWYTTGELQDCVLSGSVENISEEGIKNSSAKIFPSGTLLMAMYGATIGKLGILSKAASTNQACCALFCESINPQYLFYYLLSNRPRIIEKGFGAAQPNISQSIIQNLQIVYPPQNEQKRIASTLSNLDGLILDLRKLIAKKRSIKSGAMSSLLSGRVRLPGFTEPWISSTLDELGTFYKGKGIARKDSNSGSIPAIRYGEIYTDHNDYIRSFRSYISKEVAETSFKLESGDLCFAASGETLEEIGKTVAFVGDYDAYAGGDIVVLRPEKTIDSIFMGFRLNMPDIATQKSFKGNGVSIMHIQAKGLKEIIVTYPPSLEEQRAIAKILTDMDDDIAALEAKLKKYEQIKQGMMQQLLTGKIRLVSPNESQS